MRALTDQPLDLAQMTQTGVAYAVLAAVFALPFLPLTHMAAEALRNRSVLIFLAGGATAGTVWLTVGIALLFPDENATRWQAFMAGLTSWLASGVMGGLIYWAIAERRRPAAMKILAVDSSEIS